MEFNISAEYVAKVLFEISIDIGGSNYLVIYGRHINGYFCCIPNWSFGCEMAEPADIFYNTEKLAELVGPDRAVAIAKAISIRGFFYG